MRKDAKYLCLYFKNNSYEDYCKHKFFWNYSQKLYLWLQYFFSYGLHLCQIELHFVPNVPCIHKAFSWSASLLSSPPWIQSFRCEFEHVLSSMDKLTQNQSGIIFQTRTIMLKVKENYKNKYKTDMKCCACGQQTESQPHILRECKTSHQNETSKSTEADITTEDTDSLWDVLSRIRLVLIQLPVPQLIWGRVMPRSNHSNTEYAKSTGLAKISNVQWMGKFMLDILSGEWKLRTTSDTEITCHWALLYKCLPKVFFLSSFLCPAKSQNVQRISKSFRYSGNNNSLCQVSVTYLSSQWTHNGTWPVTRMVFCM